MSHRHRKIAYGRGDVLPLEHDAVGKAAFYGRELHGCHEVTPCVEGKLYVRCVITMHEMVPYERAILGHRDAALLVRPVSVDPPSPGAGRILPPRTAAA